MHGFPFTLHIAQVVKKAKRKRKYWLLSKLERGILSLSMRFRVKSPKLAKSIATIIERLESLMASPFKHMLKIRMPFVAERVTKWRMFARSLVETWLKDQKYLEYLAIVELNT